MDMVVAPYSKSWRASLRFTELVDSQSIFSISQQNDCVATMSRLFCIQNSKIIWVVSSLIGLSDKGRPSYFGERVFKILSLEYIFSIFGVKGLIL